MSIGSQQATTAATQHTHNNIHLSTYLKMSLTLAYLQHRTMCDLEHICTNKIAKNRDKLVSLKSLHF